MTSRELPNTQQNTGEHPASHDDEHPAPAPIAEQEDMGVHVGKILSVAVTALLIFAAASWWSSRIYANKSIALQPDGPDPIPRAIGRAEIGMVEQVPYDVSRTLQKYRTDRLKRLESWGWTDQKAGAIHMPIERAMDLIVQESKK